MQHALRRLPYHFKEEKIVALEENESKLNNKIVQLEKIAEPFQDLYEHVVDIFGEERASSELKKLFMANIDAVKSINTRY